jgi:hypothetical protein
MVSGFHTFKKPILRDAGMSISGFTVALLRESQRSCWERKKILSLKQNIPVKFWTNGAGNRTNGRKKRNTYETCEMPHETEGSDTTIPICSYGFRRLISLCSIELEAYSEIMTSA